MAPWSVPKQSLVGRVEQRLPQHLALGRALPPSGEDDGDGDQGLGHRAAGDRGQVRPLASAYARACSYQVIISSSMVSASGRPVRIGPGLPAVHDPLHRDEQDHQSAAAAGPGLDHRVLSHCRTLRARKVLLRDQEVRVVKQLLRHAGRRLLRRHPAPRRPRPGGGPARARRSCRVNIALQGGRDIDARHSPRWSGTP